MLNGALAGVAVATLESALGWLISYAIGPGKLPAQRSKAFANPRIAVALALTLNAAFGMLVGVIGGIISLLVKR